MKSTVIQAARSRAVHSTVTLALILACVLTSAPALADANKAFEAAKRTLAGGNAEVALDQFEAALLGDPDSPKYASAYRQACIPLKAYDRCIGFFQKLVEAHPDSANAVLNLGFAVVDKMPDEGAVTQVLLANEALGHFGTAIELDETWLSRYTRGNSYLFWPPIFGRTPNAIEDLERAIELATAEGLKPYHARTWANLGDGFWRLEEAEKARETWRKGRELFPDNEALETRLALKDEEINPFLDEVFATTKRVNTDLSLLWNE